jgi:hypothetical protein
VTDPSILYVVALVAAFGLILFLTAWYGPDCKSPHQSITVGGVNIQTAKRSLDPNDKLIIETPDGMFQVNLESTWEPSKVIPFKNAQETKGEAILILTIRKPDLIGSAMWQFSHGRTTISAPIRDEKWLADLHARKFALYSGDAIKARVNYKYIYDENGTLIEQKLEVIEVGEVIKGSGEQLGFSL